MVRFSIITVCLNAGQDLLDTVQSTLGQTYENFEIIVKDGGSRDGSMEKLPADPRIRVVTRKDTGIYDAMNQAVDVFVLPTREDIWGLVINEAMAYGLPIVTTDRCVAGVELVENGVNGYVVPVEDETALADSLKRVLSGDTAAMGSASLEKIRGYTIENMAKAHVAFLQETGA